MDQLPKQILEGDLDHAPAKAWMQQQQLRSTPFGRDYNFVGLLLTRMFIGKTIWQSFMKCFIVLVFGILSVFVLHLLQQL